jgi:hypothetical protein
MGATADGLVDVSKLMSRRTKIHSNVLGHYRHGDLEALAKALGPIRDKIEQERREARKDERQQQTPAPLERQPGRPRVGHGGVGGMPAPGGPQAGGRGRMSGRPGQPPRCVVSLRGHGSPRH